uniref:Uncharacterized protein n=1 Tax=Anguilla anguilla TaxID=7936 RepID=A0A0E9X2Q3_ANGAN
MGNVKNLKRTHICHSLCVYWAEEHAQSWGRQTDFVKKPLKTSAFHISLTPQLKALFPKGYAKVLR